MADERVISSVVNQLTSNQGVMNSGYALTYYPATTEASRATSVEVQPGSELAVIDIRMDRPTASPPATTNSSPGKIWNQTPTMTRMC